MTVLVAYATASGSTAQIAGWVAEEMRAGGLDVRLGPAEEINDVAGYEALVLGGALYAAGWHPHAREFARRFAGKFGDRPVWLFSSGPLDHTADETDIPANPQARTAMRQLQARAHVTFGGRLNDEARGWLGFVARSMTREGQGGDFRNPDRIRVWARQVTAEIRAAQPDHGDG